MGSDTYSRFIGVAQQLSRFDESFNLNLPFTFSSLAKIKVYCVPSSQPYNLWCYSATGI